MTNLRKRLYNVQAELEIIRETLDMSQEYPSCCLHIYKDGRISCDEKGPLPEEQFLKECKKCRMEISEFLKRYEGWESKA